MRGNHDTRAEPLSSRGGCDSGVSPVRLESHGRDARATASARCGSGTNPVLSLNTFNVNGANLAGEEHGAGELLILVHGAVGDFRSWESVVAAFATRYRVITYSRRWHYPNPATVAGGDYTVAGHTEDLIALVAASGGGPVRLVGHSYGAAICAGLASVRPELVLRLS